MGTGSEASVRIAWARVLGLPDHALSDPSVGRITRRSDDLIMFVRIWRHEVLVGPDEFLDHRREESADALTDGSRLLAMSGRGGGRLLGQATLAVCDERVALGVPAAIAVTEDPAAVLELEKACPPSDVAEVGLGGMSRTKVLVDELDRPVGGAGYLVWEPSVAHLGVLTSPAFRRQGWGQLAAAVAINDALDRGLVPQWRAQVGNRASRAIAARFGFVEVGSQTTVVLLAPTPD